MSNRIAQSIMKMIWSQVSIVKMLRTRRYGVRTPPAARNLSLL